MSLSCTCYENDDAAWYWWPPDDFSKFSKRKRKRCCSCKSLITLGADCLEFTRTRSPVSDIEERIHGDGPEAVSLASWYMCETCGEQYLNLTAYGYCVNIEDNMLDLLAEHRRLNGI